MSRLLRLNAFLLAVLWLPATVHCRVESLELSALFACVDATAATHESGCDGSETECADDACQSLEAGEFFISKSKLDYGALLAPVGVDAFHFDDEPPPLAKFLPASGDERTLFLQRTWQFDRRAAPPARAPAALT